MPACANERMWLFRIVATTLLVKRTRHQMTSLQFFVTQAKLANSPRHSESSLKLWSGRGDSNSRSRAPEARAFNQARPLPDNKNLVRVAGVEPAWTCSQGMWVAATLHPEFWWLVTELNRVHWYFRPALCRRVHEPKSGGRCETRTRISRVQAVCNPLIRTAHG